jgi:IclR helix-turn-helix domain
VRKPKIQFDQESLAVARLTVGLMRNTNAGFFPGMRLSAAIEHYYISLAVLIGDLEGKPLTISKLSRAVGFPRSTLLRKVAVLIDLGYVERVGRLYYTSPGVNIPRYRVILARSVRMNLNTAKKVSKMDGLT